MSPFDIRQFDIREGGISFETKGGEFDWQSDVPVELLKIGKDANFVILSKRPNRFLVFSYFNIDTGKVDLETDGSDLVNTMSYNFVLLWSISDNFIRLVINGVERGRKSITATESAAPEKSPGQA